MTEPHQRRQVAESSGSDAGRYDRARPSYPGALMERIVAASPGPDVHPAGPPAMSRWCRWSNTNGSRVGQVSPA